MNSKKIVEDIFMRNGIEWDIKDFNSYINPKCKTLFSIYSKLKRLYSANDERIEFTLLNSGIKDLLRMTIIVEYSEVVSIVRKLREFFPDLTGYINNKDSGYRGVHLNLKIDGLPCEIQLTPKIVAMGVDYLHTLHKKWRDFDCYKELKMLEQKKQNIIFSDISDLEKENLFKLLEKEDIILHNKINDERKDLELRKRMYSEIFNAAELSIYQNDIERMMEELRENKIESLSFSNSVLISAFNTNLLVDGEVNFDKVSQVIKEVSNYLEMGQDKLIELVKQCLQL